MKLNNQLFFVPLFATALISFSSISAAPKVNTMLQLTALVNMIVNNASFASANICPLCENPGELPKRLGFPLDCDPNNTCLKLYVDLAGIDETDPECAVQKAQYQDICCGDEEPIQDCPPTPAPQYDGPVGNEPDCPICGTLEYPGIPNAFIVARYVGEFSCAELYDRGLHGLTPAFICGPLQDFAGPVCGCGEFNPACIEDETQCWGYVPEPTQDPTPQPTLFPKRKTRPPTSKYDKKLSGNGRGGAAGGAGNRARSGGGHRMMRGSSNSLYTKTLTEID